MIKKEREMQILNRLFVTKVIASFLLILGLGVCDRRGVAEELVELRREIVPQSRYLHLPIDKDAAKTILCVKADGIFVTEMSVALAASEEDADFHATLDVNAQKGRTVTLIAENLPTDHRGLDLIRESDEMADRDSAYREKYRPQFHFAPRRGWTNDPNGLHYYNGQYHLFYQHNPVATDWGNMSWGHAVSPDLIHWKDVGDALLPDKLGTIFSGSAVVDWKNTAGLEPENTPFKTQILLYTSHGREARPGVPVTQSLAYSVDNGVTWQKYAGNPVLPNIIGGNRDPKVFWHNASQKWVMALYLDEEDYALFGSENLKEWRELCRIEKLGCSECPDIFELPVNGDPNEKKWVFWGGNGKYLVGDFDGEHFKPETMPQTSKFGGNDYAAQTFSDVPDGRRIQLSWLQGGVYPDMPFNQQFSVPRELSLERKGETYRLCFAPVRELETLREKLVADSKSYLQGGSLRLGGLSELLDVEMTLQLKEAEKGFSISFQGQNLVYEPKTQMFDGVPVNIQDGTLQVRLLIDRMSYELFVNGNEKCQCFIPSDETLEAAINGADANAMTITADGAVDVSVKIWSLASIWK